MTTKCKACGARVVRAARTCPHCGRRVGSGRGWRWLAAALLAPAAAAAVLAGGWWQP